MESGRYCEKCMARLRLRFVREQMPQRDATQQSTPPAPRTLASPCAWSHSRCGVRSSATAASTSGYCASARSKAYSADASACIHNAHRGPAHRGSSVCPASCPVVSACAACHLGAWPPSEHARVAERGAFEASQSIAGSTMNRRTGRRASQGPECVTVVSGAVQASCTSDTSEPIRVAGTAGVASAARAVSCEASAGCGARCCTFAQRDWIRAHAYMSETALLPLKDNMWSTLNPASVSGANTQRPSATGCAQRRDATPTITSATPPPAVPAPKASCLVCPLAVVAARMVGELPIAHRAPHHRLCKGSHLLDLLERRYVCALVCAVNGSGSDGTARPHFLPPQSTPNRQQTTGTTAQGLQLLRTLSY